jgi:hypothetical protein
MENPPQIPPSLKKKSFLSDPSLLVLIFSNLVAAYFAIKENQGLLTMMWVYWAQSVTIGLFNFIRILKLKDFSTEGFHINNRPMEPNNDTKRLTAFFFLFHYGFFHFVYAEFLFFFAVIDKMFKPLTMAGNMPSLPTHFSGAVDWSFIFWTSLMFFGSHLFSFIYNRPRDTKKQNISKLMFYPYARIIPMHLTILLAVFINTPILLFLFLKTLADTIMHVNEHIIREGEERT